MIDSAEARHILEALLASHESGKALRDQAMRILNELPHFDWSGIYRLEGDILVLDAFCGAATEHDRIPVGRGVCGTAVAQNSNQIVDDVRDLDNYLACSLDTRSEIVVLIRREGEIIGQIDIDGHRAGAFGKTEEDLLSSVAEILASRWDQASQTL
jgi:GAF domain-containing protein